MKRLLLGILVVLTLQKTEAQFEFDPDSSFTPMNLPIQEPDMDSLLFELRIISSSDNPWLEASVNQLTFNTDSIWNCRRGYIDFNSTFIELPVVTPEPDLKELWQFIDSLNVRTMISQEQLTVSIERDGKIYKLNEEQFNRLLPHGTSIYNFELYSQKGSRSYSYISPVLMARKFENSDQGWVSPEHSQVSEIVLKVGQELKNKEILQTVLESKKTKEGNKH